MRVPAATLVALLLVATAGCLAPLQGGPPEVTVENRADQTYRTIVYTVPDDVHRATGFYATEDGERRLVGFGDVAFGAGLHNVTLADRSEATVDRFTAGPNQSVMTTVEGWEQGDSTIYLVETLDGKLVFADVIRCEQAGQTHWIDIYSNESVKWGSTCS